MYLSDHRLFVNVLGSTDAVLYVDNDYNLRWKYNNDRLICYVFSIGDFNSVAMTLTKNRILQ